MKVKNLILSMDMALGAEGKSDLEDCSTDVIVTVEEENENGKIRSGLYIATFFTFKNLKIIVDENRRSGEFLEGKYYWKGNMVLIDRMDIDSIREVIDHIIDEGDFNSIFQKI